MIEPTHAISFGYSHKLKTLWKKGKLPTVTKGFYGGDLTKKTVSLEHLKPHSQKGLTKLWNLVLATKKNNLKRGNLPLKNFIDFQCVHEYLEQFRDVKAPGFDGNHYIKVILKTITEIIRTE